MTNPWNNRHLLFWVNISYGIQNTPFVCEEEQGLLSQQEEQEVMVVGYLEGQTDKQPVRTQEFEDDEVKETILLGLTTGPAEPSSGDSQQQTTGILSNCNDIIVSSIDVPTLLPVKKSDEMLQDTSCQHHDIAKLSLNSPHLNLNSN